MYYFVWPYIRIGVVKAHTLHLFLCEKWTSISLRIVKNGDSENLHFICTMFRSLLQIHYGNHTSLPLHTYSSSHIQGYRSVYSYLIHVYSNRKMKWYI